jgi:hypothetical protein
VTQSQLLQRENHCFVSYASEDAAAARKLVDWLALAGLRVWFDQQRLAAGAVVVDELTREICNSRACVLLMTAAALDKRYVRHEVEIALEQQVSQPGFQLIGLRFDAALDPTQHFPSLRKLAWVDVPNGALDVATAQRLLTTLLPGVAPAPLARHVFVSCGWGENDLPLTQRVCAPLARRNVRLLGDATDQRHFRETGESRVRRIMSGCTGHLLILPERRDVERYKYFLTEWRIGRELRLARRTLCVSRAALPAELQADAIEIGTATDPAVFEPHLVELHDETEPVAPHAFLACDYRVDPERNEAGRLVVEHVLGMRCALGRDYPGEGLRQAIVDRVRGANVVFADVACTGDGGPRPRLRVNLNSCVEAGIAMGAQRSLFVFARDPVSLDPQVENKTTQLPFLFRDSQIHWYDDPVAFLAVVHRVALAMRRRILNDELPSPPP